MKVEEALEGVSDLFLDTAPVIYFLEQSPKYFPTVRRIIEIRPANNVALVTSPITLAECLVHPLRLGRPDLEALYRSLIVSGEGTRFVTLGEETALTAARLRSSYGLLLADALQVSAAITSGCQAILTNDHSFRRIQEIRAIVVDDLEP